MNILLSKLSHKINSITFEDKYSKLCKSNLNQSGIKHELNLLDIKVKSYKPQTRYRLFFYNAIISTKT